MIKKLLTVLIFIFLFLAAIACGKGSPLAPTQYEEKYTIYFDANDGAVVVPIAIVAKKNEIITLPSLSGEFTPPSHEPNFNGWGTDKSGFGDKYFSGETYEVKNNITLYAQWTDEAIYTVTFNSMGGTEVAKLTGLSHGDIIHKPIDPEKKSNKLLMWKNGNSEWNFTSDKIISSSITLTAEWKDLRSISSKDDLIDLAELVKEGDDFSGEIVNLKNNITLDDSFQGIAVGGGIFAGTFDGNGYIITGLDIKKSGVNNVGFIGITEATSVVKNLTIENSFVEGDANTGMIVGDNKGVVEKCASVGGKIVSKAFHVGAIAGRNNKIVRECYNTSEVEASNWGGGIVGFNSSVHSLIENCYNTGKITGGVNLGGIVAANGSFSGNQSGGIVKNCYNIGQLNNGGTTGGIVAYQHGNSEAKTYNSYALSGKGYTGCIGSGVSTGSTASIKTAVEFTVEGTFTGWDFTDVWEMSISRGRPGLKNNME